MASIIDTRMTTAALLCVLFFWVSPAAASHSFESEEPFCGRESDGSCSEAATLPPGFVSSNNSTLLASALGSPGKGGLCCGQVVTVTATTAGPVMLHRAWAPHYAAGSTPPAGYAKAYQFGGWWSLDPPPASRDSYRHMDDVCAKYDALIVYSSCAVKAGTQAVIGPGQSTDCGAKQMFPQSPTLQVYVQKYEGTDGTQGNFEDCTTYFWPSER